ncbi:MAG: trigger factor, partial [Sphingomicrobium sp.]
RETFIRYIQQEPMAAAQLRAPLYEDKVVDFLFARAGITERKATRGQLEADLEAEEGHVHGPDCGHDHAHAPKAKKAGKGKAAAKAKDELVAEEPAKGPVEKASAKPKPAKPLKDEPGRKAPQPKAQAKPSAKKAPAKKADKKA